MSSTQVVSYRVDKDTVARFEIDPPPGFGPAAVNGEIIASVHDAVGPALEAARAVLHRIKPTGSEEVEIRFGIKVNGNDHWSIAKNLGEGNFEVSLTWRKA